MYPYIPIYLSIHIITPSIHSPTHLPTHHIISSYHPIHPSTHPPYHPIYPSIHLSIYPSPAQLDALAVQSKQKGEPMPDIQRARYNYNICVIYRLLKQWCDSYMIHWHCIAVYASYTVSSSSEATPMWWTHTYTYIYWFCREEIENVLLRKKVFNAIASYAEITYVDPPTTTAE